jgi:predicted GNAT family acetyltransferase
MEIQIEQYETKGAAFVDQDGKRIAEMTYSVAGAILIIIDHTEVDESLKGTGTGNKLLMAIVEKARNENIKILPLCPFAKSVFDKDQSIQDVLK